MAGIAIGLAIKFFYLVEKQNRAVNKNDETSEIVLIIHCERYQEENVRKTLWENKALGMAIFENQC